MKRGHRALAVVLSSVPMAPVGAQQPVAAQQSPAAARALVLRVRLLDEDRRPLAGVGVVVGDLETLTTDDALQRPIARSDEHGRIVVPIALDDALIRFALFAAPRRATWMTGIAKEELASSTERDCGDVVLPRANTLIGHVLDADGAPLPNATVTSVDLLQNEAWGDAYTCRARTDARGMFRLNGVFPTAIALGVEAKGHLCARVPWVGVGEPVEVRLSRSGAVTGKLKVTEGMQHPAFVMIAPEFSSLFGGARAPIEDGRFRVELQHPGRFRVWATDADGNVIAQSRLLEGPAEDVEIRVAPAAGDTARVRAVDAVSGAAIPAFRAAGNRWGIELQSWVEAALAAGAAPAAADGCATVHCQREGGEGMVYATADGYAPTFFTGVGNGNEPAIVRLQPAARLTCRVAADGDPDDLIVRCVWSEALPDAPLPAKHLAPRRAHHAHVTTDGTFSVDGLAAGRYTVVARRRNGTAEARCTVDVAVGQRDATATLTLPTGATLTATVTGAPENTLGWRIARSQTLTGQQVVAVGQNDSYASDLAAPERTVELHDAAFRLSDLALGEHSLTLLVATPPRTGPELRIALPAVVIEHAEQQLTVDLGAFLPGAINGKLELKGVDAAAGRIAVAASAASDRAEEWGRTHANWSLVAPDGSYSIQVAPGDHDLDVLDVVTGVQLHRYEQTVHVAPGSTTTVPLQASLATMRVRFDPPPQGVLHLQELVVRASDAPDHASPPFGGLAFSGAGISYAGTYHDVALLVPAGSLELVQRPGVDGIGLGWSSYGEQGPQTNLEARIGEELIVTLPLPERQKIRDDD